MIYGKPNAEDPCTEYIIKYNKNDEIILHAVIKMQIKDVDPLNAPSDTSKDCGYFLLGRVIEDNIQESFQYNNLSINNIITEKSLSLNISPMIVKFEYESLKDWSEQIYLKIDKVTNVLERWLNSNIKVLKSDSLNALIPNCNPINSNGIYLPIK